MMHSSKQASEVGFATLPHHINRKYAKKGFDFTIMVVGKCGIVVYAWSISLLIAKICKSWKRWLFTYMFVAKQFFFFEMIILKKFVAVLW